METKKSKSLLVRLFTVLAVLCCCLSLVFGLVACGEDVRGIKSTKINANGELIVTYSDDTTENLGVVVGAKGDKGDKGDAGVAGAQGGTLDADCEHIMVEHVIQHGTCSQEEQIMKICVECKGYEVVTGEKDANVHGVYEYQLIEGDEAGVMLLVLNKDCLDVVEYDDPFVAGNGACEKLFCSNCETFLTNHGETEWYPVEEDANVCEQEHLEVESCTVCHAIVSDAKLVGATGHSYVFVEATDLAPVDGVARKNVELYCAQCDGTIYVEALAIQVVEPTCKAKGYTVFEYTYDTYLEEVTKTFVDDETDKTTAHALGTSGLSFENAEYYDYTAENTDALNAMFDAGLIRWTVGEPAECNNYEIAGFNCADCGELVAIYLSGEHTNWVESKGDCVTDTTMTCGVCKAYTYVSELAVGHDYAFVTGSYNAGTVSVKCKTCGDKLNNVAVDAGVIGGGTSCKDPAYMIYTTTDLTNGLDVAHDNYALANVVCKVVSEDIVHNIGDLAFANAATYEWNEDIGALLDAGKIRWTVGEPADCSSHNIAGYDCDTCGELVAILLSGEHTLDATDVNEVKATCTTRGVTYNFCTACKKYIEVSAVDATGHNFVANAADIADMVAAPADYTKAEGKVAKTVTFECACGESIELSLTEVKKTQSSDKCMTTDVTTYIFEEYTYEVESKTLNKAGVAVPKAIPFAPKHVVDKTTGTHTVGDFFKGANGLVNAGTYEYNEHFKAAIEAGLIRWTVGEPADCDVHNLAGFDCEVCNELVVIFLSGEHDIASAELKTKPATCTTEGKEYKVCPDCGAEVTIKVLEKLGHNVEYTVIGATASNAGVAVGVCTRTGCGERVEVVGKIKEAKANNCGYAGYVIYEYVNADGVKVHEDVKIDIAATGDHNDSIPQTQIKFEEAGYEYLCYFCDVCKKYVVISKTPKA